MYILLIYQQADADLASTTCRSLEADGYQVWVRDPAIDWSTPSNTRILTAVSKSCDAVVIVAPNGIKENVQLAQFLPTIKQYSQNIFVIRSAQEIHAFLEHLHTVVPERTEKAPLPIPKEATQLSTAHQHTRQRRLYALLSALLLLIMIGVFLASGSIIPGISSNLPTSTPTVTISPSPTYPTLTPTPLATATATPTLTATTTPSATPTLTATVTPSATPTLTATATPSATQSLTPTTTSTPTVTASSTTAKTSTPRPSATASATRTVPPTMTATLAIFVTNTPHVDVTSTTIPQ